MLIRDMYGRAVAPGVAAHFPTRPKGGAGA
jgi:hypothetical protein